MAKSPKEIHCKYFYDAIGSALFDRICELDEYYVTRTELAIMRDRVVEMAALLGPRVALIELGSGSGLKTPLLLDAMDRPVAYVPIEISSAPLEASSREIAERFPELKVQPFCADYTQRVKLPTIEGNPRRRVVYFPGSTIGNFGPSEAPPFMQRLAKLCGVGGALLIGVDLDKDPEVLYRAYNDSEGVTAAFNLNLLERFNREMGADFDLGGFRHQAVYNTEASRVEMYLISERAQKVTFAGKAALAEETVDFAAGEKILTEYSYKYSLDRFAKLATETGFSVERVWTDERDLFSVQYLVNTGSDRGSETAG